MFVYKRYGLLLLKPIISQIISAIVVSSVNASFGIVLGYATIALPELKLSETQASWFASIDLFLAMIFSPIGGLISGWIGRKKILMSCSPLVIIGWIMIANQTCTKWMLFTGRIVSSTAVALMLPTPSNNRILSISKFDISKISRALNPEYGKF